VLLTRQVLTLSGRKARRARIGGSDYGQAKNNSPGELNERYGTMTWEEATEQFLDSLKKLGASPSILEDGTKKTCRQWSNL